jgi:hypothetical protein
MGRGGSGNWYEPKVLSQTGTFTTPDASSTTKPSSLSDKDREAISGSETRKMGRGGAGNFVWSQEEEERRKEEGVKEIELKEMVARDVEAALPRPERVVARKEKVDRAFVRDWED